MFSRRNFKLLVAVRLLLIATITILGACGKKPSESAPSAPSTPVAGSLPPAILEKLAPLEKTLDSALSAYNAGDPAAFAGSFAKDAHPPATEHTFHALFDGIYRAEFGKYVSKTLIPAESVLDPGYGQLVYNGTFEKRGRVKVSADFSEESGAPKIVQLRFEKMP